MVIMSKGGNLIHSESVSLCANKSKRDTYQDFMPIYQQLCTSARAPGALGEKCHDIMKQRLKKLRKEVFSASVNDDQESTCVDCTSYPVISTKKLREGDTW